MGDTIILPEVERVPIIALEIDNKNPNKMNTKQRTALKKNIKKFGFLIPIITNKNLLIADGQHRWEVAQDLGFKEIPVIRLDIEEVDRRILRQVLNKLRGEHQSELDVLEFDAILKAEKMDEFLELLGKEDKKLEQFLASVENEGLGEDSLDVEASLKKPKYSIAIGDVWKIGNHKLVCGDSTDKQYVGKLLLQEKVDMVFTDPPYNVNYDTQNLGKTRPKRHDSIIGDKQSTEEWLTFCNNVVDVILNNLNGPVYLCHASGPDGRIMATVLDNKLHWSATIIWNKGTMVLGRADYQRQYEPIWYGWRKDAKHYTLENRSLTDVWDISKNVVNDLHPTMKPVELVKRAVVNSCPRNGVVLDLFGGSGSTLIACEQLGRKCRMMELDPKYCSVIIERWETLTGSLAEKVD